MNIPPRIHDRIRERVRTGRYRSDEEVLDKALEALDWYELDEQLREGIADLDEGRCTEYDEVLIRARMEEIKASGRTRG
jgi:Arc/MetJ-type ribon-helix-helix transcriptional regulator